MYAIPTVCELEKSVSFPNSSNAKIHRRLRRCTTLKHPLQCREVTTMDFSLISVEQLVDNTVNAQRVTGAFQWKGSFV